MIFLKASGKLAHELVVDAFLNEDARARAADLALIEENADLGAFDRLVELGVVEDDVGGLAAELERARNQALGGRFGDTVADLGRAREGELVKARVVEHGLARAGAAAGDDVDDARGQHLIEELAELEERKRASSRRT